MVGIPVKDWEFVSVVVRGVSVCLEPTKVVRQIERDFDLSSDVLTRKRVSTHPRYFQDQSTTCVNFPWIPVTECVNFPGYPGRVDTCLSPS